MSDAVALHPPATHRIFGRLGDPAIWLFSALIVVLVLLVANPILRLVWDSFHTAQGDWTLQSYVQALGRSRSRRPECCRYRLRSSYIQRNTDSHIELL